MINRFMISVAAVALIAGTGFANAQGTGSSREGPSAVPRFSRARRRPTGSSATPATRNAIRIAAKPSGHEDHPVRREDAPGSKNQRAQDDMKAGAKGEKSAQDNMKGEKSKRA